MWIFLSFCPLTSPSYRKVTELLAVAPNWIAPVIVPPARASLVSSAAIRAASSASMFAWSVLSALIRALCSAVSAAVRAAVSAVIWLVTVVAKFSSSLNAWANSSRVLSSSGAPPTRAVIASALVCALAST